MALTGKQTLIVMVVTFTVILLIFELMPPTTPATLRTILGTFIAAIGLFTLAVSVLIRRGKLQPGLTWGRSAAEAAWQGAGTLVLGLGHLSRLIVSADFSSKLNIFCALFFIVAILAARKSVKTEAAV